MKRIIAKAICLLTFIDAGARATYNKDLWRQDLRCGPSYPLSDGRPTQCNPRGEYPCCSGYGWCGKTSRHCSCSGGCIDYKGTEELATPSPVIGTSPTTPATSATSITDTNSITDDSSDTENLKILRDAECRPVDLLVKLPIEQETFSKLETTHAFVRRCLGVSNENKSCVSKDKEVKWEHWKVTKINTGSNKKDFIPVSWISHEKCGYQKRNKCNIAMALECHEKSTTHYFDEVSCTCSCIVQIDGKEDTCVTRDIKTSGIIIWLPIATFFLGIVACAIFIYFKTRQKRDGALSNDFNNPDNENTPVVGFADDEQPAEPPPAAVYQTSKETIGFIH